MAAAGGTSGLQFVDCELKEGTAQGQPRRREVVRNGQHVKTVDVHAHCAVPEAQELMGRKAERTGLLWAHVKDRLQAMDEQGIDVEALSINPYWYEAERDLAAEVIRVQNERLAEFCASQPDRFVAFTTVALQHPDLAIEQLENGIKKLGLRGVSAGCRVGELELADPKFHPFWAKVEEMDLLVFIHPAGTPELRSRFRGSGVLDNVIGNPLDTTIALSHLIFEGTLDRFPGLKICAAHGGGYLPSYAARSDAGIVTFPDRYTVPLKKKPTEYLRQLYFDSLIFTPEMLRHLIAETDPSHIMLGTDYPFPWTSTSVDHILATPDLTEEQRVAILGGTAEKLLGI
jgi:aminocarboxymuconate-semialdehyde decarboxylase